MRNKANPEIVKLLSDDEYINEFALRVAATDGIPINELKEMCAAKKAGKLVVLDEEITLAISAGAYAIEQRGRTGEYFLGSPLNKHYTMPHMRAAQLLREITESALAALEGENK